MLAIAYHNMGVEQEFLRSYHAAILSYKKAFNFAETNLGGEDGITQNLKNVYENARSELDPSFRRGAKALQEEDEAETPGEGEGELIDS